MLAAVLLSGCNGLTKMKSGSSRVRYQANPKPVETMDDKVVVKFTGSIPEKYFDKNCAVFLQPVFTWEGGNIPLEPLTLKGEKVDGDGTVINYAKGGRFTYTDQFDYKPGMETGRVTLTPVGATWPRGKDPEDKNIRLAPSFPSVEEIGLAAEISAVSVKLAACRALRDGQAG